MKKIVLFIFCLMLLVSCTNSSFEKSNGSDSVFIDDTVALSIDDLSENKVLILEKIDTIYSR